jgi:acetyl-CoA acetyltransferase
MGNRVAIVGVGYSTVARETHLSYKQLAVQSALAAMHDAGMTGSDIDGVSFAVLGEPEPSGAAPAFAISDRMVGHMLGMTPLHWYVNLPGNFGDLALASIAAIRAGHCHTCIAVHPCRTYRRPPKSGMKAAVQLNAFGDSQFSAPFGPPGPPGTIAALAMQRYMSLYGATFDQFAMHAVTKRYHASLNENALHRDPITVDEYLESRWVTRPVRLLDCDYPCDVSGAVIFTSEERASSWRSKPVFVEAAAMASVHTSWEYIDNLLETAHVPVAEQLWSRTDLGPADVDCAQLYDGFSIIAFSWLEALGFCKQGEAGPFIADGHTQLGGSLPLNTDGGVPNVGRRHGSSHCIEAVKQLRGECGERQVPNAEVSLFTVAHGPFSSGVLLTAS